MEHNQARLSLDKEEQRFRMDTRTLPRAHNSIRPIFIQFRYIIDTALLHAFQPAHYLLVCGLMLLGEGDGLGLWGGQGMELFFASLGDDLLEVVFELVADQDCSFYVVLVYVVAFAEILLIAALDVLLQYIPFGKMIRKQIIAPKDIHILLHNLKHTSILLSALPPLTVPTLLANIEQIINRENTQNIEHDMATLVLVRLDEQAAQEGGQRDLAYFEAVGCDCLGFGQAVQLFEEGQAACEGLGWRVVHELELGYLGDADCLQLQDRASELTPEYLWHSLLLQLLKIPPSIKPITLPLCLPASPPSPLHSISLRNRHNRQHINPLPRIINPNLHKPTVHNIPQPIDRNTRLCDICSEDYFAFILRGWSEDLVLLVVGQSGVEHQGEQGRDVEGLAGFCQAFVEREDLVLAGQEDQDIAGGLGCVDLHCCVVGCLQVVLYWLQHIVDLCRIGPALNPHNALGFEEVHELTSLDCGRHDNDLEPLGHPAFPLCFIVILVVILHLVPEQGHEDISIDTPLMRLIDDIGIKLPSSHDLPNRHTISHKSNPSLPQSPPLLKPDTIANLLSNLDSHFRADPLGQSDCTDPARLCDQDVGVMGVQVLGDLGCLAAAGLAADYCCWVSSDQGEDLGFVGQDWEGLGAVFDVHC